MEVPDTAAQKGGDSKSRGNMKFTETRGTTSEISVQNMQWWRQLRDGIGPAGRGPGLEGGTDCLGKIY